MTGNTFPRLILLVGFLSLFRNSCECYRVTFVNSRTRNQKSIEVAAQETILEALERSKGENSALAELPEAKECTRGSW